jgi:purine-binding chemotaxis protein CheW
MTDDSPDDPPAEATDSDADGAESVAGVDIPTDEDGVPHLPGVDVDDPAVAQLASQAGLGTDGEGDAGPTAAAVADDADAEGDGAQAVGMAGTSSAVTGETVEDETRVLEFALGEERYCLDIEHVEELVNREAVTRVPNTPEYVEGVVDLRGQITTILDPKVLFDIDTEGSKELIVVFDPDGFEDQGALGWLVDDVNQVTPVAESEVDDSPVDRGHVEGVVERDGEYVIWTQPELAVEDATG